MLPTLLEYADFVPLAFLAPFLALELFWRARRYHLAFNAAFQHANIRTPHWLGHLIQRPESHAVHHGRGIHRWNYSDLPLWDMVFGTYRNPVQNPATQQDAVPEEAGFRPSARIGAMLALRNVADAP